MNLISNEQYTFIPGEVCFSPINSPGVCGLCSLERVIVFCEVSKSAKLCLSASCVRCNLESTFQSHLRGRAVNTLAEFNPRVVEYFFKDPHPVCERGARNFRY